MMNELDLLQLDHDIARAARAEVRWRRTLRDDANGAAEEAWYEPVRYVTTRATFAAAAELPADDVLREPLLAWIERLAVTRIAARPLIHAAAARQQATLLLEAPEAGTFSIRAAVRRALSDRDAARARVWLEGIGSASARVLAAERAARESVIEVSSRLGVTGPSWLCPYDPAELLAEAQGVLRATADLAANLFGPCEDLAGLFGELVARDVPGVWPTRADARWLFEQFRATPLLEGIQPELGPTPAVLGASSFARALARFGAAYARAAPSSGSPFVLSHDPSDGVALRRGALAAALLVNPVFLRKRIALSREAARGTARALAATWLADVRLAAVRSRVDVALASPVEAQEAAEEALHVRVPVHLSGVVPRPDPRAPVRLAAALGACRDAVELRDRYDEDWFENPRALSWLREIDDAARPRRWPKGALEGWSKALARSLEELAS